MEKTNEGRGKGSPSLVDIVLSWTIKDVLNENLYQNKVPKIPETFLSTTDYKNSIIPSLIEETHSDLSSGLKDISQAPTCEILKFRAIRKSSKDLHYQITLKGSNGDVKNVGRYEPRVGDLIALTDIGPNSKELNRPRRYCHIAYVQWSSRGKITILMSKHMEFVPDMRNKAQKLYAAYLLSMTTNIRIWKALNSQLKGTNLNIIGKVLQADSPVGQHCHICFSGKNHSTAVSSIQNIINSQNLNECQKDAVLSCVTMRKCHHNHTVKLIWGPPGTGKTKTVASMLFTLLKLKSRTLTCAPTNTAVLEVAARLHSLVKEHLKFDTYGLGDIVLFGNNSRMKVDDCQGLPDIFLDYRVDKLERCLDPRTGWKHNLESMINLLENPHEQYLLSRLDGKYEEVNDLMSLEEFTRLNHIHAVQAYLSYREHEEKDDRMTLKQFVKKKYSYIEGQYQSYNAEVQFVKRSFSVIGKDLEFCLQTLYTHLPTSYVPFTVAKDMFRALDLLKSLQSSLLRNEFIETFDNKGDAGGSTVIQPGLPIEEGELGLFAFGNRVIQRTFKHVEDLLMPGVTDTPMKDVAFSFGRLSFKRDECLSKLRSLCQSMSLPQFENHCDIKNLCLKKACLIFCTASGCTKLFTKGMPALPFVVIDEAAQLKECESAIPLQLPGIRHAILIGDERQLHCLHKSF